VVRVEDGTLLDLGKWFRYHAAKKIGAGSTVIIASGTQLMRMGLSAYVASLQSAMQSIRDSGPKDLTVIPGPILLMDGTKNFGWVAAVADLSSWLVRAAEEDRQFHLYHTHSVAIDVMKKGGRGKVKTPTESMVLLPMSLNNKSPAIVQLGGGTDAFPEEVIPLSEEAEARVIITMIQELNTKNGCGLSKKINVSRAPPEQKGNTLIFVGSDHAARLRVAAVDIGLQSHYIGLKGTKFEEVQATCEKLSEILASMGESEKAAAIVVIQNMDHSAFIAQDEDGQISMPTTDEKGTVHMVGSVDLSPMSTFLRNAEAVKPLIAIASGQNVVVLAPFPRYTKGVGCCQNHLHATNVDTEQFRKDQERGLAAIKNKLNTAYVESKLWNVKAHNVVPDLEKFGSGTSTESTEQNTDGEDPLHPPLAAYHVILRSILNTSRQITAKNEAHAAKGTGTSTGTANKKRTHSEDRERAQLALPLQPSTSRQRTSSGSDRATEPRRISDTRRPLAGGSGNSVTYRAGQVRDVREEMRHTHRTEYESYSDEQGEVFAPSPTGGALINWADRSRDGRYRRDGYRSEDSWYDDRYRYTDSRSDYGGRREDGNHYQGDRDQWRHGRDSRAGAEGDRRPGGYWQYVEDDRRGRSRQEEPTRRRN